MPHARDAPPIVTPRSCFSTWPTEVGSSIRIGVRGRTITSIQNKTPARIKTMAATLRVLIRNHEVIEDPLAIPNRGSLHTFAAQGFPIHWLATSGSRVNPQFFKESKKEVNAATFKDGQNRT
jgi:hypothetical protein